MLDEIQQGVEASLDRVEDLEDLKADEHIQYIFDISEWLFDNHLDNIPEDKLVRVGGKLAGIIAFLGDRQIDARAEREAWKSNKEDVYSRVLTEQHEKVNKTTIAREKAKQAVSDAQDVVNAKDAYYRKIKNVVNAAERMLVFIQSAIKVKNSERYRGEMNDNS